MLRRMTRLIHLVRHGQASAGSANYDRLSPCGREQAAHLGRWWRRGGFRIDAAWHGTLERQRDTATLALEAAGLSPPVSVLEPLDEYDHRAVDAHLSVRDAVPLVAEDEVGVGTVTSAATLAAAGAVPVNPESMDYADYADIMRRWRDTTDLPDSLEHWHAFASRGWQAIAAIADRAAPGDSLAFFTSGGIVSTVLATVLGLDFEHTIDAIWRVRNASVTTFAYEDGQARLVEFNAIPHLQVHHDPALITLI